MTDKQAREAAHEAFGGLISTAWANASDWEREEVRRSVDAAIDAYLAKMREGSLIRQAQADALRAAAVKFTKEFVSEQNGIGYPRVRVELLHTEADRIECEGKTDE